MGFAEQNAQSKNNNDNINNKDQQNTPLDLNANSYFDFLFQDEHYKEQLIDVDNEFLGRVERRGAMNRAPQII